MKFNAILLGAALSTLASAQVPFPGDPLPKSGGGGAGGASATYSAGASSIGGGPGPIATGTEPSHHHHHATATSTLATVPLGTGAHHHHKPGPTGGAGSPGVCPHVLLQGRWVRVEERNGPVSLSDAGATYTGVDTATATGKPTGKDRTATDKHGASYTLSGTPTGKDKPTYTPHAPHSVHTPNGSAGLKHHHHTSWGPCSSAPSGTASITPALPTGSPIATGAGARLQAGFAAVVAVAAAVGLLL